MDIPRASDHCCLRKFTALCGACSWKVVGVPIILEWSWLG